MKGNVLAHVRRVQTSPEGRALVHAVEDAGLEHKLEVPVEAVRGVSSEQGYVLMIAWSLHPVPHVAEPTPTPTTEAPASASPTRSPTAVDEAFMALMARGRRTSPASAPEPSAPAASPTPATSPASSASPTASERPEQQLAALLGLHARRPPT